MNWLTLTPQRRLFLAALTLIGLTACGGGGGGDPPPPPTLTSPTIVTGPQAVAVEEGAAATFTVQATGSAPLTYEWKVAGRVANATGTTLTLPAVTLADNDADIMVTVRNPQDTATALARLTVTPRPVPPLITEQPASQTVVDGTPASFSVVVTGTQPMNFEWLRGGVPIAGATQATYRIAAARAADAGVYRVRVRNRGGDALSLERTLTVLPVPVAPTLSAQPAPNTTVTEGGRLSLSVTAQGTGPLTYVWDKDGTEIDRTSGATYAKEPVGPADAGTYRVTVSNGTDSVTSNRAVVTVNRVPQAPTIRTQPQNVQANAGASAVFQVTADGWPRPTFQWRRNGVDIAGATGESYTLGLATVLDDAARFSVVVTNAAGTVPSAEAVLSVRHLAQVAGGGDHTLALKADGSVYSWGNNAAGQLGDGTQATRLRPVAVQADATRALDNVVAIAASLRRSLALRRDGSVLAWGLNRQGLLGDGSTTNQPHPVPVLTEANGAPLIGVVAIAAGQSHSLALRSDGTVLAWGFKTSDRLGNPAVNGLYPAPVVDDRSRPVTHIVAIAAGGDHSLALRSDGTVLAWGSNIEGQLGDGTTDARAFAAVVKDAAGQPLGGIRALAAGRDASYALRSDGTLLAWGSNVEGQLGDGTNTSRLVPVTVVDALDRPLAAIRSLWAGESHALALDADGCVLSWGSNRSFQLGVADFITGRDHGADVEAAAGASQCFAWGIGGGADHSLVIDQDGKLLGWGANGGRLGDGTNGAKQFPTAVLLGAMF